MWLVLLHQGSIFRQLRLLGYAVCLILSHLSFAPQFGCQFFSQLQEIFAERTMIITQ